MSNDKARASGWDSAVAVPPGSELKIGYGYPNRAERVIRVIRDVAAIVALLLVSLLMLSMIQAFGKISDGIERIEAPAPAQTECVGELC